MSFTNLSCNFDFGQRSFWIRSRTLARNDQIAIFYFSQAKQTCILHLYMACYIQYNVDNSFTEWRNNENFDLVECFGSPWLNRECFSPNFNVAHGFSKLNHKNQGKKIYLPYKKKKSLKNHQCRDEINFYHCCVFEYTSQQISPERLLKLSQRKYGQKRTT